MQPVNIGIVGTGNIAHRFARAIKHVPNVTLTAVASRTATRAEAFAAEFGIPHRFASYEEMAASPLIDAAYIAVPHAGHKDCTLLMLRHDKHVLCEKPLAVNAAQCAQMLACARDRGVLLMEAMWTRFLPATEKLLEIVQSGALGELRAVEANFCYDMGSGAGGHHVLQNANGGGSLLDVGTYCLHFAKWLLGEDVASTHAVANLQNGIDAHTQMLLHYRNGAVATLSSAVFLQKEETAYIYGTNGYARADSCYAPQIIELHFKDGERKTHRLPFDGNGFAPQIEHFATLIRQGAVESPLNTHTQSLFIARQMDEIRRQIGLTYPQDSE